MKVMVTHQLSFLIAQIRYIEQVYPIRRLFE